MILKIETQMGFSIWGDIHHIDVKQGCIFIGIDYTCDENKVLEYQYGDKTLHVRCDEIFCKDDKIKDPNFEIVTIHRNTHELVTIAFDTRAYLTNDQGKTIERF